MTSSTTMAESRRPPGRAAVTFDAPQGPEVAVLNDGDVVKFGRGDGCHIRFGFAPVADTGVPRVAGLFVVANQRVFIETTANPGRPVPEVRVAGQPPMPVGVGAGFSPPAQEFRVLVRGDKDWQLHVRVRGAEIVEQPSMSDPLTKRYQLKLTTTQRRVLAAYVEPLRRGRHEPATHRQVADALGYHPNSAREVVYELWARMFASGIPMPDRSDKRIAVVEAVLLHGLLT